MTCLTNDGALRRECVRLGIPTTRGLRLLLELARGRHLTRADAITLAERIRQVNPLHVTQRILDAFIGELASGGDGRLG